ncbi:polysaccharide pyruvyl transferase family protein [Pseudocolwellia agarivorans]|uniref:polysaccharide pyruvyl transferase family protein n=1 Tax=Pseudocolwellia agarivorans TaxID=1911682 RepID=UPI001C376C23|nr:polysaccharide pyruvyl transferase family protein [Pseudocolwellia agarivorans]
MAQTGKTLEDEAKRKRELVAIGSVIHLAKEDAVIWGSGVNGKIPEHFHTYNSLEVRAVRGPYTREWLKDKKGIVSPEIYGDPALLLPSLTNGRFEATGTIEHVFVPNLNDMLTGVDLDLPEGTQVVSPMQSWHRVVEHILKARFVTASSLHGLVIAEAFGIPARYVRLSKQENLFKYKDYYAGTDRHEFEYANSIHEGLEMKGEKPIVINFDSLKDAFPYDLWI